MRTYKLQGVHHQKTLPTTSFQSYLEERMLTRDAMSNLMKADYKRISLPSNVGDAAILRLQPYGQKSLLAAQFLDFRLRTSCLPRIGVLIRHVFILFQGGRSKERWEKKMICIFSNS